MAIITLEGKLHIDLADVWAWLGKEGYTKSQDFKALAFSVEDDALVLTKAVEEADQSSVYVEAAEFWRWVIDQQLPAGRPGGFRVRLRCAGGVAELLAGHHVCRVQRIGPTQLGGGTRVHGRVEQRPAEGRRARSRG